MSQTDLRDRIRQAAYRLGYDLVGFTAAQVPQEDAQNLAAYVEQGHHAGMKWFADSLALRQDPGAILPGAKTAIVLGVYYRDLSAEPVFANASAQVSRYALGRDYHRLLRKRGQRLLHEVQKTAGATIQGRVVVDSAPVAEKILARQAGLGWQGKHTNLIHPELGSYFFLSVILIDAELAFDSAQTDLCGECRLCLDACPTDALKPYQIDSRRCISYLNIERSEDEPLPEDLPSLEGRVFGCDICQEVCPYNRSRRTRSLDTREESFRLRPAVKELMEKSRIESEDHWQKLKEGSALKRAGRTILEEHLRVTREGQHADP